MNILIAGGAGYIGSSLVPALLARGHEVNIVDLLWFGNHLPAEAGLHEGDVCDLDVEDLVGFDAVVFLAGLSNDPMADFSPKRNFVENLAAPVFLAHLARKAGVPRFIHGGSCSVYGHSDKKAATELDPTPTTSPYGMSKLYAESICLSLATKSFAVTAFRKGTVSGYSPRMRFDLIINAMVKDAVTRGIVTINDPRVSRPILSIRDAVKAYVAAIEREEPARGIFNLASETMTVSAVARAVRQQVGGFINQNIESECLFKDDPRSYVVSTEKARHALNFKKPERIGQIIEDVFLNLTRCGDLTQPKYYNIATFKALEGSRTPASS